MSTRSESLHGRSTDRMLIPKGWLAIAQRFSVGLRREQDQVPKGRLTLAQWKQELRRLQRDV